MERKTARCNIFKTEEEHKFALSELNDKFYEDLDAAHAEVNIETSKRLAEEALGIEAVQALQDERQYHAGQIEKQKIKLTKEHRGHALVIDHLKGQWKERMSATTLRMKTESTATTAKVMKRIEEKTEKKNAKEREKLTNKLERKEDQLETVIGVNKKR